MEISIRYFLLIALFSVQMFSQIGDSLNIHFEKSKYQVVAQLELNLRYNFEPIKDDALKYLKNYFELNELKVYSIPIFDLLDKNDLKKCKKPFLELINFESNPNKQKVIVEHDNRIVSEFKILNKTFDQQVDSFYELNTAIFYYEYNYNGASDFPYMIGGPIKYFFTDERLETRYFRFDIEGFKGTFILKDNIIYYVTKELPPDVNIKQLSVEEEFKLRKTKFIEVESDFKKKINKIEK